MRIILVSIAIAGVQPAHAQSSIEQTMSMAEAMADCFWERKPVAAQVVATNGLKQDATVSAAMKTGFDACKDVYGEHAVTPQGEPVLLNPQIFLRELRKSDPNEGVEGGNS